MKTKIFLLILVVMCFIGIYGVLAKTQNNFLFTEDEAKTFNLSEEEWYSKPYAERGLESGPLIVLESPQFNETENGIIIESPSPLDLQVEFKENKYPIDMNSFFAWVQKGLLKKNLTERLRNHINGTKLDVKSLSVPVGKYSIRVEISDLKGNKTIGIYKLKVTKK